MKEKIAGLRANFIKQLEQTGEESEKLKARLSQLSTQVEQLKGAIYALDSVAAEPAAEAAVEKSE